MRKKTVISIIIGFLAIVGIVAAFYILSKPKKSESVNIYLFYSEDDKQSKRARVFLDSYTNNHDNVELIMYDVWNNEEDLAMLKELRDDIQIDKCAIPLVIVGDNGIIGYLSDGVSGEKYKEIIEKCDRDCDQEIEEIDNVNFQYEPSIAPIERPEDENKEDDVC